MSVKRRAFTILEIIIVLVVISILSSILAPRLYDNRLQEAVDQLLTHIRYTQHLALLEDRYDPSFEEWYKERWQIFFSKSSGEDTWAYTIFSDRYNHTGKPDPSEIAVDPFDNAKRMTGGYTSGGASIEYSDSRAKKSLNIGKAYGIQDVRFVGCGNSAKRLSFDYLGRPYYGDPSTENEPFGRLLVNQCKIELCLTSCESASASQKATIAIEPTTGYVHSL